MQQSSDSFMYYEPVPLLAIEAAISLRLVLSLFLLATLVVICAGCDSRGKLPQRSSKEYSDVVSAFYAGLAALQVGNDVYAENKLSEVTQRAPGEPAGWANWGVLALRQRNFDAAAQRLERARDLAPQDGHIYNLLGILESNRGHAAQAIDNLRKAADLNPTDLRTAYALALEIERQGNQRSEIEFEQLIQKILAKQPDNLAALLELSRVAAKRGDAGTLKSTVAKIGARSSAWPPEAQQQLAALEAAAAGTDLRAAATRTTILRNALMRVPEYRESYSAIKAPPGEDVQPFIHFLRLESPVFKPAPADMAIAFDLRPVADTGKAHWNWIGAVQLGEAGAPVIAEANGLEVHLSTGAALPFPGGPSKVAPSPEGVLQLDFNYDFKTDLVLAGAGGVRLFRQDSPNAFTDVTRETKLSQSVLNARYIGAWAVDIEADGDLDIVLGSSEGVPVVLRNNGDGAFVDIRPFAGISGVRQFVWADLNGDGNPDAAIIDASGRLHVFINERQGQFRERSVPTNLGTIKAIAVADANNDGMLDLLGLSEDGQALQAINHGSKNYHWQVVRPRAAQAFGDQRINPFGIGGEIEIRAGLLVQKQPITGPQVHFGLGEQTGAEVVRVIWPNGAVRAEFDVKADQEVVAEQRLKGSCPFLFAYNGKQMEFVKDAVPWGSAIGLRINTLGSANIAATEEWYKIRRDQLVPHDGFYDLRFTAELWEVYYYDYLTLMTVDHPVGTEVFVDERFVIPPARLAITAVATPHKIARAIDDTGQDVTEIVAAVDGKSLDSFGHGQYQGVTRDHYLEIDLGEDAPHSGPLYLIAHGSIYPTDSSINVAMTQGNRWRAHGLSLEVPDGRGGWIVARDNLGFPAGRKKTILVDLTNVFRPGTSRRLRLRTNLEIYWDQIQWAQGLPDTALRTVRLDPTVADLHYRGYSVISRPDSGAPELPDYNRISGTSQRWRDLIGYYTRYGDVRELLQHVDDRYVIVNSGDEMELHFAEQPPPPAGWVRDFVIMGDGWIKDGDYNSTFSNTVLPLPYHAKREYNAPPGRLEDEWVYRQHPDDWQTYHTRYVTPDVFNNALRIEAVK